MVFVSFLLGLTNIYHLEYMLSGVYEARANLSLFLRRNPSPYSAFAGAGTSVCLPFPGHFEGVAGRDFKTPGLLAGKWAGDGPAPRKVADLPAAEESAAGA